MQSGRAVSPQLATPARGVGIFDRWLAARVQQVMDPANVRLELWDCSSPYNSSRQAVGDVIVRDRRVLLGLAFHPDLWFGEGYMLGRLDVRGSLQAVVEALSRVALTRPSFRERLLTRLALPNTLTDARQNVHHHYDLGNSFYERWLDRDMVYTCAYFADPAMSLEEAQRAKLDIVCRKLRLRPGDRVVEAGCGWGALALHMAREYGVRVRAFNVSQEQLCYARDQARKAGLCGQVEFVDDDYRNVSGQFDVFVSVGMLEHVGLSQFRTLATVLRRCLRRDGGRGLLHFIGRDVPRPVNAWIRRRIFPGGYTPTLADVTTRVLGPADMSVLDVENLRLHYARTLDHWAIRFAAARRDVCETFGAEFARAWELYLIGSEAAFSTGWLQLFQVLFAPRESAPPSWTRSDLYTASGADA